MTAKRKTTPTKTPAKTTETKPEPVDTAPEPVETATIADITPVETLPEFNVEPVADFVLLDSTTPAGNYATRDNIVPA